MIGQFDLMGWMEDRPEAQAFEPGRSKQKKVDKRPNKTKDAYSQARSWLSHIKPAIEGQRGYSRTFGTTVHLIKGFDLSQSEAISLLDEWNTGCQPPWDDKDLAKIVEDADKKSIGQPNGYKLRTLETAFSALFQSEDPKSAEQEDRQHSNIIDDPASIALRFFKQNNVDNNLCIFRWWNDQYFRWNGSYYDRLSSKEMDSILFWFIEDSYIKKFFDECSARPLDEVDKVSKKKVSKSIIESVKIALNAIISIDNKSESEPFWLSQAPHGWKAEHLIPASNRLIHLPSFASNLKDSYIPKSPKLFSTYSLSYDFNFNSYTGPVAPPYWWDCFLKSIWPNDPDSVSSLQEWFGYFLTPNTRFQKMLMLIGAKRSGKGTILRVLNHLLGFQNVAYPTFKLLTSEFGKQSLMGKSLAIFPDARITSRTDVDDLVELLLSITGEDPQTINRKYLETSTKKLFCRFIISSNVLPKLRETSGALVSRAIILKFDKSFLGNEDTELEEKLIPEIPEILRWAIDGWVRLNTNKSFMQTATGATLLKQFMNLSSHISNYFTDCLDEGDTFSEDLLKMFANYRSWSKAHNREYTGDLASFQSNLQAYLPAVSFGEQPKCYNGDQVAWSRDVLGVRVKPLIIREGPYTPSYGESEFDEYYKVN